MSTLFYEGGLIFMSVITLILVLLLYAAWKAPAWVKEAGLVALAFGFFSCLLSVYVGFLTMSRVDVESTIAFGGFRMALIPLMYGVIVYIISLVIRIIQKPWV